MAMQNAMDPDASGPRGTDKAAIQAAIQAVLAKESLGNERKLAYVRAVVLLISSALDVAVYFFPQPLIGQASVSPTIALFGLLAAGLSGGLLLGLRRMGSGGRQLLRLQVLIPLFDGLLLAGFITNIARVFGEQQPMIIANITALCCLLAVSGGLRLRRRSAVVTTGVALVNFAHAAQLFELDLAIALFAAFTVFGTGFLGVWVTDIVYRQVRNEAGRVLMERFLPKPVVEAAFETPMALLQRPRQSEVTVMVTDLRGFTRFSEKLEPEQVLDFLNNLQGLLSRVVVAHGGWVDKFMGDGMLAVFGGPQHIDNHAEQAVQAARVMLRDIQQLSPLDMGIGLHSGSVVTGCLGQGAHLEFTVIGDTVNVAARLEALTKPEACPLLMSRATRQSLADPAQAHSLGVRSLRGRDDGLEVFTLTELLAGRSV